MNTTAAQEFRKTSKNAGIFGATVLCGALFGFILQLLIAYYFGAGSETDAYFMALGSSEMLSKLLLGGSLTSVFIPVFLEHWARGQQQQAWRAALNILHVFSAVFALLVVILGLASEPFVALIAPGFDESTAHLTAGLIRLLLPAFLLLFVVEMLSSLLYALQRFFAPAALRVIAPIVSIIAIVVLASAVHIYALAAGLILNAIVQLLFLARALKREQLSYQFVFSPRNPEIIQMVRLVAPFIVAVLATQAAGIMYRILVSNLESGSLSALKFAEKITQFLTLAFLTSVTTVIYPLLSEKASRRDFDGMRSTIASAVRLITLLTLPLIIGVAYLREPVIRLVYERGSFTPEDTALTTSALFFLVLGLTINGISSVFGHATLALQKTQAAAAVSVASQAVAIALFVVLVPLMGHNGLALASALVPLAIILLYGLYLHRYIDRLPSIFLHRTFAKLTVLAILLMGILYGTTRIIRSLALTMITTDILTIAVGAFAGSCVFFGGAYLCNIPEARDLVAMVRQKISRTHIVTTS
jgi:putative peptidoglycan lipid II flippase